MTGMGFRAGTQKHDGREEKILLFSIRPRCNYRCVDAHKFGWQGSAPHVGGWGSTDKYHFLLYI